MLLIKCENNNFLTIHILIQNELICRICMKSFNSRNSLFKHVKESGHAIHLDSIIKPSPPVDPNFGAKRSKNKKRNKKHKEII